MSSILLTPYDGALLGPIAKLLGWVMDGIYNVMYNVFGIENVGLSIIFLTIVIYTLMLPFTIKQQKFSKLSQKMQPELKAIQDKYKGKKDEASMMAMNQETQMLYAKYGISPMGSCLQMLIQMPIWFALYRVFSNVPAYIGSVKDKFEVIASEIVQYDGFAEIMQNIQKDNKIVLNVNPDFVESATNSIENVKNFVVDILYKLPSLETLITPNAEGQQYFTSLDSVSNIIESGADKFYEFNRFIGLNISDTPWNIILQNFNAHNYLLVFAALCIPVFSYLTQVMNIKLMNARSNTNNEIGDSMAQSMKMMNKTMPLMMLFMCFITPVGLGIYWVVSSLYRSLQQVAVNKYVDSLDLDDIIKKNEEKAKKKREKMGVYENQIRANAGMTTRTLSSKASYDNSSSESTESVIDRANEMKSTAKPGSLSAKANLVRDYNERNSRK